MEIPCDMLLHPELLTNEQLLFIIHQRQLRVPNMERMTRDELLEVFHRFCVPFGQRKYRDSGRGKILNRTRQTSPETVLKFNTMEICHNRKNHSNHDRIKPPPDLLSGHMKRIKLESKPVMHTDMKDVNGIKRKICMNSEPPSTDVTPRKKDRKPITWP